MILLAALLASAQDPGFSSGTFSVAEDPRDTVNQTRQEERNILDELSTIDIELQGIAAEVDNLRVRKEELEARQLQIQADLSRADEALQTHRREVASWLRLLYLSLIHI